MTPFGHIMKHAVESTPNAIGGAFAASDGELVDLFAHMDAFDFAVLTAQYGVVLAQLHAAFGTLHYGGHEMFLVRNAKLDLVLISVDRSYYALLAMKRDPSVETEPFPDAITTLETAVAALRREMG